VQRIRTRKSKTNTAKEQEVGESRILEPEEIFEITNNNEPAKMKNRCTRVWVGREH